MSTTELVQLGSKLWLRPQDVVGVRWIEPRAAIGTEGDSYYSPPRPGYVVIERERSDSFGSGPSVSTDPTDWSLERVKDILQLPDSEPIRQLWESLPA